MTPPTAPPTTAPTILLWRGDGGSLGEFGVLVGIDPPEMEVVPLIVNPARSKSPAVVPLL
jgi:hypothetical protein